MRDHSGDDDHVFASDGRCNRCFKTRGEIAVTGVSCTPAAVAHVGTAAREPAVGELDVTKLTDDKRMIYDPNTGKIRPAECGGPGGPVSTLPRVKVDLMIDGRKVGECDGPREQVQRMVDEIMMNINGGGLTPAVYDPSVKELRFQTNAEPGECCTPQLCATCKDGCGGRRGTSEQRAARNERFSVILENVKNAIGSGHAVSDVLTQDLEPVGQNGGGQFMPIGEIEYTPGGPDAEIERERFLPGTLAPSKSWETDTAKASPIEDVKAAIRGFKPDVPGVTRLPGETARDAVRRFEGLKPRPATVVDDRRTGAVVAGAVKAAGVIAEQMAAALAKETDSQGVARSEPAEPSAGQRAVKPGVNGYQNVGRYYKASMAIKMGQLLGCASGEDPYRVRPYIGGTVLGIADADAAAGELVFAIEYSEPVAFISGYFKVAHVGTEADGK